MLRHGSSLSRVGASRKPGAVQNWYALLSHWTEALLPDHPRARGCNLYWAQQAKHVEAWRGADFGIAVRVPGNRVRIALYQAKRCRADRLTSVLRGVTNRGEADRVLIQDRVVSEVDRLRAPGGDDGPTKLHQVHRLELWRRRGLGHLKGLMGPDIPDHPWCRYVFWHDAPGLDDATGAGCPTVKDTRSLFDIVRANLVSKRRSPFVIDAEGSDFGSEVCRTHDLDLILPLELARDLLGALKDLNLPDFVGADGTEGGGAGLRFWQTLFADSNKEVSLVAGSDLAAMTPQPTPPSAPEPPAPEPPAPMP